MISILLAYAVIAGLASLVVLVRLGRTIDRVALAAALGLSATLNPDRAAYSSVWREAVTAERQARGELWGVAANNPSLVRKDYVVFSLATLGGKPVMLGALDRIVVLPTRW